MFKSKNIEDFEKFKESFHKKYLSKNEQKYRQAVYANTLKKIEKYKEDENITFEVGVTEYSDLTWEEFKAKYLAEKLDFEDEDDEEESTGTDDEEESEPNDRLLEDTNQYFSSTATEVDWTEIPGAVTPVRSQGTCGSCYAFATVAAVENAIFRRWQIKPYLSEQELVSCASQYNEYYVNGCNGGWVKGTLEYIKKYRLAQLRDYPYEMKKTQCDKNKIRQPKRYWITSYKRDLKSPNPINTLLEYARTGVVYVSMDFRPELQHYKSGIYQNTDSSCGNTINHAVNVVGFKLYSSRREGTSYLKIRNSWGDDWGEKGYMRIAIGDDVRSDGTCGVARSKSTYLPMA